MAVQSQLNLYKKKFISLAIINFNNWNILPIFGLVTNQLIHIISFFKSNNFCK